MAYYRVTFGNRETIVECDQPMSYVGEIYKDRLIGECDEYGNLRVPYISPETEAALEKAVQEFVSQHPQFIKDTQTPEQLAKLSEPTQEASKPFDVEGWITEVNSALFSNLGLPPDSFEYADLVSQFGKQWRGGIIDYPPLFKPFSMSDEQNTPVNDTVANPQPVEEATMKPERFTPVTSMESIDYYVQVATEVTAERIPRTVTGVQGMLDLALSEQFTLPPTFNAKFYSEYYADQAAYGRLVALYNLIMKTIELREDIQRHEGEETLPPFDSPAGKLIHAAIDNATKSKEFPAARLDTHLSDDMAKHEGRKVVTSALNDWKRRVDQHNAISSDLTQEQTILQEAQFKHLKRYVKGLVKSILENTEDTLIVIDVAEKDSFGFITGSSDGKSHTRHFTIKYYKNNWNILEA